METKWNNIPDNEGLKTNETTQKIIELLKNNPSLTRQELAQMIGNITEDGVKYHLDKLKEKGFLKRIGPDKGGSWEILK